MTTKATQHTAAAASSSESREGEGGTTVSDLDVSTCRHGPAGWCVPPEPPWLVHTRDKIIMRRSGIRAPLSVVHPRACVPLRPVAAAVAVLVQQQRRGLPTQSKAAKRAPGCYPAHGGTATKVKL